MSNSHKASFVPAQGIYLLNHSVGRPPVSTLDAWNRAFLEPWEHAGEDVWPRWLEAIERFRDTLATLLNGHAANFCPQVNLSSALTKILSSLSPADDRRTILYTEQDFPSIAFVLQQAVNNGYTLKMMPSGHDFLDPQVWSDHISPDVAMVLVTHAQSNTGLQLPVADICALARARDAISIVDIAQSVGVIPIDLQKWQADFIIGSCVKWLCGGPGAGFMWVDTDRLQQCEPRDVGWFSHESPFEFDINNFRYAADALRFWGGTPSVQPYITAQNSIQLLQDIGINTVRQHNLLLTQQIIDAVDPRFLVSPLPAEQRSGTVVLQFGGDQQDLTCSRLQKAGVGFDVRPAGIRLSPHIYNETDDIIALIDAL